MERIRATNAKDEAVRKFVPLSRSALQNSDFVTSRGFSLGFLHLSKMGSVLDSLFPAWGIDSRDEATSRQRPVLAAWVDGCGQVSRYLAPDGGGVFQLSGTKVMPDFCGTGAVFPGTGGTTVRPLQDGHGICRPEYCSSHSRCCPQCEQLNLNWLIKSLCLSGTIYYRKWRKCPAIFSWHALGGRKSAFADAGWPPAEPRSTVVFPVRVRYPSLVLCGLNSVTYYKIKPPAWRASGGIFCGPVRGGLRG